MHLKVIESGLVEWIHLAQGQTLVAGSYKHSIKPAGSSKSGEFLG
jgi:hypothetical protein